MLERWPFSALPDRERATLWAGRPSFRAQLESLERRWARRKASEITVIWADFGQGKTHSLMHLQHDVEVSQRRASVHYVQLPPLTTGSPFVALYRQLMLDFPLDYLGSQVFEHFKASPMQLLRADGGDKTVLQLLWLVGTNSPGKSAALRWLRAEPVPANAIAQLTIGNKALAVPPSPRTAQDCQNTLDAILRVATDFPTPLAGEVVLLVDEFQRIGELPARKRIEVCSSLHLVFNRHPQGLRMVLAFARGLPQIIDHVLTPDLLSRVATRLSLPAMSVAEGRTYLEELLAAYGYAATGRSGVYEPGAIDAIVDIADPTGSTLSPRKINIAADILTNEVLDVRDLGDVGGWQPIGRAEILAARRASSDGLEAELAEVG